MDSEILKILICGASVDDDHFLEDPIGLQCGHSICKACLGTLKTIKCKCGIFSENIVQNGKPCLATIQLIKANISSLYNEMTNKIGMQLKKLTGKI